MTYDLLIVGGGPAALSAAIYAARKDLKVLVACKKLGGQINESWEIENYLGLGKINGIDFAKKMHDHIMMFENIEVKEDSEVRNVDKNDDIFVVKSKKGEFLGKAVLIATGSKPRMLGAKNEGQFVGKGISYCATCDAPLFKGFEVVIIGGGNSALEATLELSEIGKKVYILNLGEEFTGDEELEKKVLKMSNVSAIYNAKTLSFNGDKNGFVESLIYEDTKTNEKKELKVKGVFVEIGSMPALLENGIDLNEKREIIIDKNNMTSEPGIFAAGDVTNTKYKQISIATGEGAKAALSIYEYLNR